MHNARRVAQKFSIPSCLAKIFQFVRVLCFDSVATVLVVCVSFAVFARGYYFALCHIESVSCLLLHCVVPCRSVSWFLCCEGYVLDASFCFVPLPVVYMFCLCSVICFPVFVQYCGVALCDIWVYAVVHYAGGVCIKYACPHCREYRPDILCSFVELIEFHLIVCNSSQQAWLRSTQS